MPARGVCATIGRTVRLNRIESILTSLEYPVEPSTVATECDDVSVRLADGDVNFDRTIGGSTARRFDSAEELRAELMSLLPREAVGEPYQSDGDA